MRTVEDMKKAEVARLQFLLDRNPGGTGLMEACAFAAQTRNSYMRQLRMRPRKYAQMYRLELIVSCLVFRKFLRSVP
jgi:hypothetical protein